MTTEEWCRQDIQVLSVRSSSSDEPHVEGLAPVLFAKGDTSILNRPAAAILNSRGKSTVSPGDQWLSATRAAYEYAIEQGLILVSGYGNIQYSVVSALAMLEPMIIACHELLPFMAPDPMKTELASFSERIFSSDNMLFLSAIPPGPVPDLNTRRAERDMLVAEMASVLLIGGIRKGGNMERIVRHSEAMGKKTLKFNETEGKPAKFAMKANQAQSVIRDETKAQPNSTHKTNLVLELANAKCVQDFKLLTKGTRYLIHYTRSLPGPWPGQNMMDYCMSLINGEKDSAHTAFDTLMRMIKERRIRASSKLIRGRYPVVSFTECAPSEVCDLREWRSGLIRWSFEPYGLAFPLQDLFTLGARPVIYAVEDAYEDLSEELRYLFQLESAFGRNWSPEKEWRLKGDLEITASLEHETMIIVKTSEEALTVRENCRIQTALAGA